MKLTVWRAVGMVVAIALVVLFLLKKTTLDIVLIGLFLCAQSIFKKDESK